MLWKFVKYFHFPVLYNGTHNTLSMVTLSHTRKEIVVSFRGSANSWNIVLDFVALINVRPNDASNIKVHTGFYIATMSLYERVSFFYSI